LSRLVPIGAQSSLATILETHRRGLTWLRRLAGGGQGSKSGCGEGGGCHQSPRRPWDGTATPFDRNSKEVERVHRDLEPPPQGTIGARRCIHPRCQ
jgi:hypothetical protein